MKKVVRLNPKELLDAAKWLQDKKRRMVLLYKDLLTQICEWIIDRANKYIENSDIGDKVKKKIQESWTYVVAADEKEFGAKIINTADKAVFVEFGVGVIGEQEPHPNADETGYQYNVDSLSKDSVGSWHFFANEADLDLPSSAIEYGIDFGLQDKRHRMKIYTRGAEGVMYAYNALQDIQQGDIIRKMYKTAWERVMK